MIEEYSTGVWWIDALAVYGKGALRTGGVFGEPPTTIGLAVDDPDDPPEGWVYAKGRDQLVPRRGRAGHSAREWLKAHQPKASARVVMEEHGLPFNDLLGPKPGTADARLFNCPVVFHHAGTIWACYRGRPGRWSVGPSDPDPTWTERKLSEYHAAREARDASEVEQP